MTYDQGQSPRLGQTLPPELPGIQLLTLNSLPEVAFRGQIAWLNDENTFTVFDGDAWQTPTVGGAGSQTFIGATPPVADAIGDLWFNTTLQALYVWMGETDGGWVPVLDNRLEALELTVSQNQAEALDAIQALQSQVEVKTTTFYQSTAPTSAEENDLWFNTATNRASIYTGPAPLHWVEIQDEDIQAAIAAAGTAQATADQKIDSYRQDDPPAGLGPLDEGDLWFDTNDDNHLWRWSGASWVDVKDARIEAIAASIADVLAVAGDIEALQAQIDGKADIYYASTFPWANGDTTHAANDRDIFFDTDDKSTWLWVDATTTWTRITDPDLQAALDLATETAALVDGKIQHFVGSSQPWANGLTTHDADFGDIWTNTAQGNAEYYWSAGRTWTILPKGAVAVAPGALDATTITGALIRTASSGARMEMAQDAGGGVIRGYTPGATDPAYFNPGSYDAANGNRPYVYIQSAVASSFPNRATLRLQAGPSGTPAQAIFENTAIVQSPIASGSMNQFGNTNVLGQLTANAGVVAAGVTSTSGSSTINNLTANGSFSGSFSGSGVFSGTHSGSWSGTFSTSSLAVSGGLTANTGSFTSGLNMNGQQINAVSALNNGGGLINMNGILHATRLESDASSTPNAGNTYMDGTGRLFRGTSSAAKYKHDINPAMVDLEAAYALEPKTFVYNEDYCDNQTEQIGFIADEAHALGLDYWVEWENEEIETFAYSKWVVALQAMVIDLNERLIAEKERGDAFEAQLAALTSPGD